MKIVRCFVRSDSTTTIICPACSEAKNISVASYKDSKHTIKVRCSCQEVFAIHLDFRHHYRKKAKLPATYKSIDTPADGSFDVLITNISLSGLNFFVSGVHYLKVGERLSIEFQLSDKQKTRLKKEVVIRNIRKNSIGCQFAEHEPFEKALGFYLQN